MALVDLNSIQFYKPSTEASLPRRRVWKASGAHNPTAVEGEKQTKASGSKDGWDALCGNGIMKFDNMANISLRRHPNPLRESTSNLQEAKADLECKMFDALSHTILINTGISKEVCNTDILDRAITEHHNGFPTLKELLLDAGELSKLEQASLSREYATQRICEEVISSQSYHDKDIGK